MQKYATVEALILDNKFTFSNTIFPSLLADKAISHYIINRWKTKIEYYGQYFPKHKAISQILSDVKFNRNEDAIRMYTIFYKTLHTEPSMTYALMWDYILAFCGFIRTKCSHIFYDPLEFNPEEFTKNFSLKDVATDKVSTSILGGILGIAGISILAKWEENSEKKNQSRLFKERSNRYYEYVRLPMVEIFNEEQKLEDLRKSLQNI